MNFLRQSGNCIFFANLSCPRFINVKVITITNYIKHAPLLSVMQSSLFPTLVILSLLVAITFLRPIHAQDEIDQEDDAADSFADDIDIEESPRYKRLSNVGINLKPLEFIKKDDDEIENARIKKVAPQDDGDSFRSDPGMAGLNQDDDDDLGLSGKNSKPQKDHKDKIHKANDLSTVPQGLGESCNSHNAERITNYLENVDQSDDQAALDGVMDLVSGPPDKSFCDYRQFLTCRNGSLVNKISQPVKLCLNLFFNFA